MKFMMSIDKIAILLMYNDVLLFSSFGPELNFHTLNLTSVAMWSQRAATITAPAEIKQGGETNVILS